MRAIKIDDIPLPSFYDACYPPPPKPKKLARTRRRGRRRGISLRALRTNYRAAHVVVELAIIEGTRSALRGGYIKSAFLMYFYLYIFFKYYIPSKTTII
jgi:hypothetical protein